MSDRASEAVETTVYRSDIDGAIVIEIDTQPASGHVRINLNDGTIWDRDPEEIPPTATDLAEELLGNLYGDLATFRFAMENVRPPLTADGVLRIAAEAVARGMDHRED